MSDKLKVHQEQTMDKRLTFAVLNGFVAALVNATTDGTISSAIGEKLTTDAHRFTVGFLSGDTIDGLTLESDALVDGSESWLGAAEDSANAFKQGYPDGR